MNNDLMRRFGWHDLMTTEIEASMSFYGELFGWTFDDARADGYRFVRNQDGLDFGGFLPWPETGPTMATWTGYVLVENVDSVVRRVEEGDGRLVMPATDYPDGRLAPFLDPDGADCILFQPTPENDMSPMGSGGAGEIVCWNELITHDVEIAAEFYRACFGWEFDREAIAARGYAVARFEGRPVAGVFQPSTPPARSGWVTYFTCADIDSAVSGAVAAGATLAHPVKSVAGIGQTCWIQDPYGALFGLMRPVDGWLERL